MTLHRNHGAGKAATHVFVPMLHDELLAPAVCEARAWWIASVHVARLPAAGWP